jgi:hypothetical protein
MSTPHARTPPGAACASVRAIPLEVRMPRSEPPPTTDLAALMRAKLRARADDSGASAPGAGATRDRGKVGRGRAGGQVRRHAFRRS